MEYILPFVPEKIKNLPTHMDFDGQRRAEKYYQVIIIAFAVIGFIRGYITQQISDAIAFVFLGSLISSVLMLVPWGMYRRQPLNWQPARDEDGHPVNEASPVVPAVKQVQNKQKKKLKE
uniref:Signal peptidase complex subunit 1 n=1 Tax=Arion vulgaris TaxID=1028688 RepID=A0A0B6Y5V2_9EUPU